jgi:hypothetical protein
MPDSNSNRLMAVAGAEWRTFTYDTIGRLQSESRWDGARLYNYDPFNRLAQVTITSNWKATYTANALNQRAIKFAQARVVDGAVEWPDEIDLSYDTLYLRSLAVQQATAT